MSAGGRSWLVNNFVRKAILITGKAEAARAPPRKAGKSPVDYLKKYPNRIELLHIKDDFVIGESGTIDFEGIFNQFYKNKMKNYVVEIEVPQSLRDKTNPDGSKYTQEQISEEMFKAAEESIKYMKKAKFVK